MAIKNKWTWPVTVTTFCYTARYCCYSGTFWVLSIFAMTDHST